MKIIKGKAVLTYPLSKGTDQIMAEVITALNADVSAITILEEIVCELRPIINKDDYASLYDDTK